jgi:uncharacterized protein YdhG (YjbR/CyaY superfamily)
MIVEIPQPISRISMKSEILCDLATPCAISPRPARGCRVPAGAPPSRSSRTTIAMVSVAMARGFVSHRPTLWPPAPLRQHANFGGALLTALLHGKAAGQHNGGVSAQEIDQYLAALEEPKRATLALLRQRILDVLPEAEQGISYGLPAFKIRGKTIAGFAAFKNHLSYLPHSGSVFPQLRDELKGYVTSSGALRFDIGDALPAPLVGKLIAVRLKQAFPD